MDWSVKPQPLVGEILPGFTAISILLAAYLIHSGAALTDTEHLASSGSALAGGLAILLLGSWVLGTAFDTLRDLLEWPLDKYWFKVNWDFLTLGEEARIKNLENHWLACYFLTGNFSIALMVCLLFSIANRSTVPLSSEGTILIVAALGIFIANAASLRCDLRHLMKADYES
jgi:hypothetical protein